MILFTFNICVKNKEIVNIPTFNSTIYGIFASFILPLLLPDVFTLNPEDPSSSSCWTDCYGVAGTNHLI